MDIKADNDQDRTTSTDGITIKITGRPAMLAWARHFNDCSDCGATLCAAGEPLAAAAREEKRLAAIISEGT